MAIGGPPPSRRQRASERGLLGSRGSLAAHLEVLAPRLKVALVGVAQRRVVGEARGGDHVAPRSQQLEHNLIPD